MTVVITSFSAGVWGSILGKCGGTWRPQTLDIEVARCLAFGAGALSSTVLKLGLAATIYHLWRERNSRVFQSRGASTDMVTLCIVEDIRSCLCSWKAVKRTHESAHLSVVWKLPPGFLQTVSS
ncbi:hypothetical protein Vadar_033880 [Vaccinium darrowii]|uniref:Uncharacterized protein n=1 Tax=Vaccinium darrowii TaxID=229202 RepID=A0ACB7XLQ4_9ERIC|nr:hypothetical protein Vadar_033880 [Vaccinium darrowii]